MPILVTQIQYYRNYRGKELSRFKDLSPTLKIMHELKEKITKIFEQTNN
jgi:hypothetical protein